MLLSVAFLVLVSHLQRGPKMFKFVMMRSFYQHVENQGCYYVGGF